MIEPLDLDLDALCEMAEEMLLEPEAVEEEPAPFSEDEREALLEGTGAPVTVVGMTHNTH